MPTVTLQQAQASLPDLIERLQPGEPVIITRNDIPIARLLAETTLHRQPRKAGSAKGLLIIARDDEEHLRDFEEYMG